MTGTQPKRQALALRVHSRVRVVAITIRASDSPGYRRHLLSRLGTTGTIDSVDPRFTLPFRVKLDDGDITAFAEDNLEVLEPDLSTGVAALQHLVEAISRHPAAEDDPAVADAVNAIEEALRQGEAR